MLTFFSVWSGHTRKAAAMRERATEPTIPGELRRARSSVPQAAVASPRNENVPKPPALLAACSRAGEAQYAAPARDSSVLLRLASHFSSALRGRRQTWRWNPAFPWVTALATARSSGNERNRFARRPSSTFMTLVHFSRSCFQLRSSEMAPPR